MTKPLSSDHSSEPPRSEGKTEASTEVAPTAAPVRVERGEVFDMDALETAKHRESGPSVPLSMAAVCLFLVAAAFYFLGGYGRDQSRVAPAVGPFEAAQVRAAKPTSIKVHVVGRVKKPGVYELSSGARIQDAIQKAGGAAPNSDVNALNLADWAKDGDRIEVPALAPTPVPLPTTLAEVPATNSAVAAAPQTEPEPPASAQAPPETSTPERREPRVVRAPPAASTSASQVRPAKPKAAPKPKKSDPAYLNSLKQSPVNINTASVEELQKLPGVGLKTAERIIAHRTENGAFASVDDLNEVKGIGEKRTETLREVVAVR